MKYHTKQQRLMAVLNAYRDVFQKPAVTAEEVGAWAYKHKLHFPPPRGCPETVAEFWEALLELAIASTREELRQTKVLVVKKGAPCHRT